MDCKINFEHIKVSFGNAAVLRDINLTVCRNSITGFMGPSGSGKSTLISLVNRMIDFEDGATFEGRVSIDGSNVLDPRTDVISLRKRVGTVFAVPLPLPRSIFENIAYGLRLQGMNKRTRLHEMVAESLSKAFLFEEVRDRLHTSALKLSGGQQQRLCLARTLAVKPEIILLDEPCSGLDPISTAKIEEALSELKKEYTIVLVSNNTKQIARATDYAAFFYMGKLVEYGATSSIFTTPAVQQTEDYIQGKFG
jgi:phosphate transport system ATP-binding protein